MFCDFSTMFMLQFLANDDFTNRRKSCRGSAIPRINLKLWAEAPEKPSQFSAAADNLFSLYMNLHERNATTTSDGGLPDNLLPPLQENTDEDKENTVDQVGSLLVTFNDFFVN